MPRLSCWFVKAALLHLAVGVLLGGLILSAKGLPTIFGWAWLLLPTHIQLLVGGWLIQLALGVAYWILPRLTGAGERGRPRWAWLSFGALNAGVLGAALALPLWSLYRTPWLGGTLALAALLQVVALGAFIWHAWPRLQPIPQPVPAQRA
ncbi:MAG TPA: hypothetical protein VFZ66_12795 [Herpetosiphonaceae bacterium]